MGRHAVHAVTAPTALSGGGGAGAAAAPVASGTLTHAVETNAVINVNPNVRI
jgi:hypothetical protein